MPLIFLATCENTQRSTFARAHPISALYSIPPQFNGSSMAVTIVTCYATPIGSVINCWRSRYFIDALDYQRVQPMQLLRARNVFVICGRPSLYRRAHRLD